MIKMKEKEEAANPIDINGEIAYEHHKQIVGDNQISQIKVLCLLMISP